MANIGHLAIDIWDQIFNQHCFIYTTTVRTFANRALFGHTEHISSCYSFSIILMQFSIAEKHQFYRIDPQSINNGRKIHGFPNFDENKQPRMSIESLWHLIFPLPSPRISASDVPIYWYQYLTVIVTMVQLEYLKKRGTFNWQFFARILNLQSELQNSHFENLTLYDLWL